MFELLQLVRAEAVREWLDRRYLGDVAAFLHSWDFIWTRPIIGRHTPGLAFLTFALLLFIWTGPAPSNGWRLGSGIVVAVVGVTVWIVLALRAARSSRAVWTDLLLHLLLLLVVVALVWTIAGPDSRAADDGLYRHVGLLLVGVFAACAVVASAIACWCLRDRQAYDCFRLNRFEPDVFARDDGNQALTWEALVDDTIFVLLRMSHVPLLAAAIAVLAASAGDRTQQRLNPVIVFIVVVGALVFLRRPVRRIVSALTRPFMRGTALLVSAALMALAVMRIAQWDYVTTLLDGTPGPSLLAWLLFGYVASWWYDYWVTRMASDRLLQLLGSPTPPGISVTFPDDRQPDLRAVLEVHGAQRWAVQWTPPDHAQQRHLWGLTELFARLSAVSGDGAQALAGLRLRYALYATLGGLIPFGLVALLLLASIRQAIRPELQVQPVAPNGVVTPSSLMFDDAHCSGRPVVALAASGGGTRAAIYAASVLQGLDRLGRLGDVRLMSGVSGGGAATAYFASHRPEFLAHRADVWPQFFDQMKASYIHDVLNGAGEWRIATDARLGILLAESFARRWKLTTSSRAMLDQVSDVGVIFNTSIAGTFDGSEVRALQPQLRPIGLMELEQRYRDRSSATMAGSRLLLTNLMLRDAITLHDDFTNVILDANQSRLPMVVINNPGISFAEAVALNANFPPVFSNAAIDIGDNRYWVTDGGTIDNRGMEAMLYALRQGIRERRFPQDCQQPPPIHMVVADASLISAASTRDRGLGTMMSAGSMLASQLAAELVRDVRQQYEARGGRLYLHYLPMPVLLRQVGSFGTNWMLQPYVTVTWNQDSSQTLTGEQTLSVVRALHDPTTKLDQEAQLVYAQARADAASEDAWRRLSDALKPTDDRKAAR